MALPIDKRDATQAQMAIDRERTKRGGDKDGADRLEKRLSTYALATALNFQTLDSSKSDAIIKDSCQAMLLNNVPLLKSWS
eukprot:4662083-Pyramimonas_sp.AAC.1